MENYVVKAEMIANLIAQEVNQIENDKKQEYLELILMELTTSFKGKLFDNALNSVQKYWENQMEYN